MEEAPNASMRLVKTYFMVHSENNKKAREPKDVEILAGG
jgi:hypothetical protein